MTTDRSKPGEGVTPEMIRAALDTFAFDTAPSVPNMRVALEAADRARRDAASAPVESGAAADLIRTMTAQVRAVQDVTGSWRDSARHCDDDYGDTIRDMADAIDAALSPENAPSGERG